MQLPGPGAVAAQRAPVAAQATWNLRRLRALALAGLMALALCAGIFATFVRLSAPFAIDERATSITSVAAGSYVWVLGVRAGQTLEPWPVETSDRGFVVVRDDGSEVSLSERFDAATTETLLIGGALLLGALVAYRIGLPGFAVGLGLGVAALVGPYGPALGYPDDALFALMGPLAGALVVAWRGPRSVARACWLIVAALATIVLLASATATFGWPWTALWKLPAVVVVMLGLAGISPALAEWVRGRDVPGRERTRRLLERTFPIVGASRNAASSEERTKLATELHNMVLPNLGQAILELDDADPAARPHLNEVVEQLRGSIGERQTTILEHAGLATAVRSYVAGLRPAMKVTVDCTESARAAREVEFAVYRVAQLAVANAVEHSSAEHIAVTIDEAPTHVGLRVVDDGVGMDAEVADAAVRRGRIGLTEMRRIAYGLGADLQINSSELGTSVDLRWRK